MIDLIYPPKPVLVRSPSETKLGREKEENNSEGAAGQTSGDELVSV